MNNMNRIALLLVLLVTFPSMIVLGNEPDSVYVFAYTTSKNQNQNGLHFAWSIDKNSWHAIGPEYSYLRSDFGRWGSQKRMFTPAVFQDVNGVWNCFFRVTKDDEIIARTTSPNLLDWKPQSYLYASIKDVPGAERMDKQDEAEIDGEKQQGTVNKAPWSVVDGLIKAGQIAGYKHGLYAEAMSQDPMRFAGLKPVEATLTLYPERRKAISNMLVGIFFEDINYAADGGIYAEQIQNRDFEYSPADKLGSDPLWNSMKAWRLEGNQTKFSIDSVAPVHENNKHYALLKIEQPGAVLINEGFNGIPVKGGDKYYFSLFSRVLDGKGGKMSVRLVDKNGETCGQAVVKASSGQWKKQEVVLSVIKTVPDARLEICPQFVGTVALDMISLFPQDTFKGRRNGLRKDLAQTLADISPRFIRFPGGCVAHGDGLGNMYRWKNTIGPLESRKPQRNIWGYHQTGGLGYFEYFQFCEDIGAEPLPVLPAGVPCQNSGTGGHGQQCGIPMNDMGAYVQEVLDLIEWANGDAKTTVWGKKRAEAGHPKPFNLKYIGIGNEDLISDVFQERYVMICKAIREKYPEMTVIGTVGPFYEGSDYEEGWRIATELKLPLVDEHYYNSPGWYIHNQEFYDRYDRSKSKVYLGEYAAHVPGRSVNIETALAEALHLANVERNGDVVCLTSYAPLLAKEGFTQWNPDLIYFTNTEVKPTVSYYVQQLYGRNSGDVYLPGLLKLSATHEDVRKRVAQSVVYDSRTGDYIIKLINLLPVPVNTHMDLSSLGIHQSNGELTILSGTPDDQTAKPVSSDIAVKQKFEYQMPAYSFMVLRLKADIFPEQ